MDNYTAPADRSVDEIESLCMNCQENGTTRLLLTRIPFFREVVLMSFDCPHCHFKNSEIQSAGAIQPRGSRYIFKAESLPDLQRQVVKSDTCVIRVEDLDLEIPPGRGQLTNLEGLLSMVKADLEAGQPQRKEIAFEVYLKIEVVVQSLGKMLGGEALPLTISLVDPAGNSSLEPSPNDKSGKYVRSDFPRSPEQNEALGLGAAATDESLSSTDAPPPTIRPEYSAAAHMYPAPAPNNSHIPNTTEDDIEESDEIVENRVYSFPTPCPGCTNPCTTNMKMVRIPHFAEVVIMSTVCEHCGYRTNEVKSGGAVSEKGRRITLRVATAEDLSRDILKAESCALECPELQLNVEPGTLGGRFTTVEGLLAQVRDDLKASIFDAEGQGSGTSVAAAESKVIPIGGDSMPDSDKVKWDGFFGRLDRAIAGEALPFTVIMTDPLAASYVQSFNAPDPDDNITVEDYERTEAELEDLGLNDMKTEGYEGEPEQTVKASTAPVGTSATSAAEPLDIDEIQNAVKSRLSALEDNE